MAIFQLTQEISSAGEWITPFDNSTERSICSPPFKWSFWLTWNNETQAKNQSQNNANHLLSLFQLKFSGHTKQSNRTSWSTCCSGYHQVKVKWFLLTSSIRKMLLLNFKLDLDVLQRKKNETCSEVFDYTLLIVVPHTRFPQNEVILPQQFASLGTNFPQQQ